MTQMTAQQLSEIKAQATGTLNRGGEHTYTGPAGHVAKIGYVANGAFCRAELRNAAGHLLSSHAAPMTHEAMRVYAGLVNIAAAA